jgi:hypothetical protein
MIRSRISLAMRGRPPRQRRPRPKLQSNDHPCRRQPRTVSALTIVRLLRQPDHQRDRKTQNKRSDTLNRGRRVPVRRSTAIWWCKARISKTSWLRSRSLARTVTTFCRSQVLRALQLPNSGRICQTFEADQVLRNDSQLSLPKIRSGMTSAVRCDSSAPDGRVPVPASVDFAFVVQVTSYGKPRDFNVPIVPRCSTDWRILLPELRRGT